MEINWNEMVKVIFIDTPAEMRIREEAQAVLDNLNLDDPYWSE